MSRQVKAVLFDFGGVFTASPFAAVEAYGRKLGRHPAQVMEIVFGGYHEDSDHPWHQLERGEISLEASRELILALGREQGMDVDIYHVLGAMAENDGGLRRAMVDYARKLRPAGLVTGVITNNVREFRDGWRSMVPVDELFDFVVDSSEVGMRKPDPAIFHRALELAGVDAGSAVFLDDFHGNVRAAESLGMATVHVGEDIEAAIAALDALLRLPR